MGSTAISGLIGTVRIVSATCSRPGCQRVPAATLLYDYASRLVTIDRLSTPHPMQYDLCSAHADRLSVPNGWTLVDRRADATVTDLRRLQAS